MRGMLPFLSIHWPSFSVAQRGKPICLLQCCHLWLCHVDTMYPQFGVALLGLCTIALVSRPVPLGQRYRSRLTNPIQLAPVIRCDLCMLSSPQTASFSVVQPCRNCWATIVHGQALPQRELPIALQQCWLPLLHLGRWVPLESPSRGLEQSVVQTVYNNRCRLRRWI